MESLSSDEDFEQLSYPCSETASSDEADMDIRKTGHLSNSALTRPAISTSPSVQLEVQKPLLMSAVSVKGREETLPLSSQLFSLATNAEQLVV